MRGKALRAEVSVFDTSRFVSPTERLRQRLQRELHQAPAPMRLMFDRVLCGVKWLFNARQFLYSISSSRSKEVHLDDVHALSATGFTASAFDVEGKLSGFIAACFGFDGLGEDFADGVEYACIGDGIRSRSPTDRGSMIMTLSI
jgi:hypothetical protein